MPYLIYAECPNCDERANGIQEVKDKFGFRTMTNKERKAAKQKKKANNYA